MPATCQLCNMIGYEPIDYPVWIPREEDPAGDLAETVLVHGSCGEFFEHHRPLVTERKERWSETHAKSR